MNISPVTLVILADANADELRRRASEKRKKRKFTSKKENES